MKTNTMEKIYSKSAKIDGKFKEMAAFIVDTKCTEPITKTPVIGEHRTVLIGEFSNDMQIGSLLTKNKYLTTGLVAGAVVFSAVGIFVGYKLGQKCLKDDQSTVEEK